MLVVDDSPESLGMLNLALNQAGYTALVALSGAQAISIAEKVEPDIILLDGVMPEMDGFETCKQLKQIRPNTPIIFMTGLSDVEHVVKGFNAGGTDYVTKPIAPDEVIARIKTHIQTSKLALSAQEALDHAGKFVFCVDASGQLTWATPHTYELIDKIKQQSTEQSIQQLIPQSAQQVWQAITPQISQWLSAGHLQNLMLTGFDQPIEVIYERSQDQSHLLRISQAKISKKPDDLKNALGKNIGITKRESEVLYWIAFAKSNWEISQILSMSPRTVTKHLEQIYKKLNVDNRTAAAAISIRILEGE